MGDSGQANTLLIVYIVVTIVVILICREIACWYWKINKAISLLESIDQKLDRLPLSSPLIPGKAVPQGANIPEMELSQAKAVPERIGKLVLIRGRSDEEIKFCDSCKRRCKVNGMYYDAEANNYYCNSPKCLSPG